jgi:hypothetical protein
VVVDLVSNFDELLSDADSSICTSDLRLLWLEATEIELVSADAEERSAFRTLSGSLWAETISDTLIPARLGFSQSDKVSSSAEHVRSRSSGDSISPFIRESCSRDRRLIGALISAGKLNFGECAEGPLLR